MQIKIVGNGVWGTALAGLLKENSHEVSFLTKESFQSEISLEDIDVLVLAVPTQAIREVLGKIKGLENKIIINSAKGIEKGTHKFPYEIVKEILGENVNYFSLMGPSFSQEVEAKMPTVVNLGYVSEKDVESVKKLFETSYFEIKPVGCVAELELAGAFKNIYAIACGMAVGFGFGMNSRVKIILEALYELHGLMKSLNFPAHDETIPGVLGDLILTCSSTESRNFTFGKLITKLSTQDALAEIKQTVEGVSTAPSVEYFAKKSQTSLYLAEMVAKCIELDDKAELKKVFVGAITKEI